MATLESIEQKVVDLAADVAELKEATTFVRDLVVAHERELSGGQRRNNTILTAVLGTAGGLVAGFLQAHR